MVVLGLGGLDGIDGGWSDCICACACAWASDPEAELENGHRLIATVCADGYGLGGLLCSERACRDGRGEHRNAMLNFEVERSQNHQRELATLKMRAMCKTPRKDGKSTAGLQTSSE